MHSENGKAGSFNQVGPMLQRLSFQYDTAWQLKLKLICQFFTNNESFIMIMKPFITKVTIYDWSHDFLGAKAVQRL